MASITTEIPNASITRSLTLTIYIYVIDIR